MFKIKNPDIFKNDYMFYDFGCGDNCMNGYIGVDRKDLEKVDIVSDVESFFKIPGNSAIMISSCHFIEHLSLRESIKAIKVWKEVLKNKGKLQIFFPDIGKVKKNINDKIALNHILGGQSHDKDYHKSFWTIELLTNILQENGFINIVELPYLGKLHPYKDNMAWTSGIQAEKIMKVSIIIATYKDGKNNYIKKCIESIDKTISFDHEIVIVDTKYPRISVAEAWNEGILKSSGEIIIILNDDTIVSKKSLDSMISLLISNDSYGVIAPTLSCCGTFQKDIYNSTVKKEDRTKKSISQINEIGGIIRDKHKGEYDIVNDLSGCCMVFRRRLIDDVGLFETMDSLAYAEDNYWLDKVKSGEKKLVYLKDSFVYHEGGKTASRVKDIDLEKARACLKKRRERRKNG